MNLRGFFLLALIAVGGAGCDLPGRPTSGDRSVPSRDEKTFAILFKKNCAGCHGADGNLGPAPPLNDGLFLALVPDAELMRVIQEGRQGTLMPAFGAARGGHLTDEQVHILAEGIKPRWHTVEPAPLEAPAYLFAPTKKGEIGNPANGRKVYATACAFCHGENGQGGTSGADSQGPSPGAINQSDFLALISDQALRRLVITGRPDLGMPDYKDAKGRPDGFKGLSSQDVADLVALLASWRQSRSDHGEGK